MNKKIMFVNSCLYIVPLKFGRVSVYFGGFGPFGIKKCLGNNQLNNHFGKIISFMSNPMLRFGQKVFRTNVSQC